MIPSWRKLILVFGIATAAATLSAQTTSTLTVTSATKEFSPGIAGEIEKIVANHKGVMGVYCKKLDSDEVIAINADEPFESASTIKTALMVAVFDALDKGEGPFESYYDKRAYEDSKKAGGSGLIQNYKDGTRLEVKELVHLMMTVSDNVGTNMLAEWMGLDPVNDWLKDHGFEQTRMFSTIGGRVVWSPEGRAEWGLGRTTPKEMGDLLVMIATGKAGSKASSDEMLRVLGHQYFDSNIPAGVPPTTWVGSKSGSLSQSRSDTALVNGPSGMYVLSVFSKHNEDKSWNNSNEAQQNIRKISNLIWNHFNPDSQYEPPAGTEKF